MGLVRISYNGEDTKIQDYLINLSLCGGVFLVRTPPTPPNHQLQWTPPEFLDSNGLQWVYIENIQEVIVVLSPYYL